MSSAKRRWLTVGLVAVLAGLVALIAWLLAEPLPNPFAVGFAGLSGGALIAILIALWWPSHS
ncbi:hypothetical protein [Lacticaseibacillus yichunensis]|uniref:Uncharacterized protein n=1 Tax=Lacticaseibacillus yichunensis TaxID=2486015 RepID=A0ABW4CU78_9LACO|nr:hypothetical protein [Lacticaseibacillus yichunensis]